MKRAKGLFARPSLLKARIVKYPKILRLKEDLSIDGRNRPAYIDTRPIIISGGVKGDAGENRFAVSGPCRAE